MQGVQLWLIMNVVQIIHSFDQYIHSKRLSPLPNNDIEYELTVQMLIIIKYEKGHSELEPK